MHDQWLTHTHTYLHLPLSQTDSVISLLTHSLRLITDSVMSLRTSRPSMECSLPDCQVFTKTTSNQLITLYCITFHCITLHCITSLHCTSHHFNLQRSKKRGCRLKRWHGRPVAWPASRHTSCTASTRACRPAWQSWRAALSSSAMPGVS